jgi:polyisoprenoid-binding protein YceI
MLKRSSIAFLLTSSLATATYAAPASYTVDSSHTFPSFSINHLGFSVQHGRFDNTTGHVTLDTDAKKGSIDVAIDVGSLNTGWKERDDHLKSKDFFNAEKFPTMTFKSSELTFEGDKLTRAKGELTLLGVTKPVELAVTHFHCGQNPISKKDGCGANAAATIKRSDFGMAAYVPAVGDEVTLSIQIEAYNK